MKNKFFEINTEALGNPQVGDYWSEHFSPYFLIVKIDGDDIYVLACTGGENSAKRKHELYAKINLGERWGFDYSKAMIVDKSWIDGVVNYQDIEGFVADVVRKGDTWVFVTEWNAYQKEHNQEIPRLVDLISPEYDLSIHTNPDAMVWAKFFMKTYKENPKLVIDEELMVGWFSNAMMAMHDHLQGGGPINGDQAQYLLDKEQKDKEQKDKEQKDKERLDTYRDSLNKGKVFRSRC